jgi:hypothetical protein
MDKSDFALDESTHENLVAVADSSRHREDLVTFRMRPPHMESGVDRSIRIRSGSMVIVIKATTMMPLSRCKE